MAEKSKRFLPTSEADDLLSQISAKEQAGDSGPRKTPSAPRPSSERKRPAVEKEERTYTVEQERIVRMVRTTRDYYKLLKVEKTATKEEVTKAFRKLAVRCHPDKNSHPGAEDAFKKLNTIKGILTDDQKRKTYDRFGEEGVSMGLGGGGGGMGRSQAFTEEDLFRMFFEGPRGRRTHRQHTRRRAQHAHPNMQSQYLQLLQFAPLLILFIFSLLSGPEARKSPYSLTQSQDYPISRKTIAGTPYYVSYKFDARYGRDARALYDVEARADEEHLQELHNACHRERKERKAAISRAQSEKGLSSEERARWLDKAYHLSTESCMNAEALVDARA